MLWLDILADVPKIKPKHALNCTFCALSIFTSFPLKCVELERGFSKLVVRF
jgi:hypothetical protein